MSRVTKPNFTFLLAALAFMLVITPLFENRFLGGIAYATCLTIVFVTALVANRKRRLLFALGIIIASLALPLTWTSAFVDRSGLTIARTFTGDLFLVMTAGMILYSIVRDHVATLQAVVGAICVYLLMGLTFALLYSTLEQIEEQPFRIDDRRTVQFGNDGQEVTVLAQMVYFSFVTMTTLGFGDIVPRTHLAETCTWVQAVVGQMYVAVLIARLVAALPMPPKPAPESSPATRGD